MAARSSRSPRSSVVAQAGAKYDYDLVIIGCGVGGHGAALHAVEQVGSTLAKQQCTHCETVHADASNSNGSLQPAAVCVLGASRQSLSNVVLQHAWQELNSYT